MNFDLLTNEDLSLVGSLYKTPSCLTHLPINWNNVSVRDIVHLGCTRSDTLICVNRGIIEYLMNPQIRNYYKDVYIWLIESPEIDYHIYSVVGSSLSNLKKVCRAGFVSDSQLLEQMRGFFYPVSIGTISDSRELDFPKDINSITQPVKLFCSSKVMCLNHRLRLSLGRYFSKKNSDFNFCLVDTTIQTKYPSLQAQMADCLFSVVIENLADPFYFTEKIIGCFASRTVPILYGSCLPEINGLDINGILMFKSINDLELLINSCNIWKYIELSLSVEHNYKLICQDRYQSLEHQLAFSLALFGFT